MSDFSFQLDFSKITHCCLVAVGIAQVDGELSNVHEGMLIGRDKIEAVDLHHTVAHKLHLASPLCIVELRIPYVGQVDPLQSTIDSF